MCDFKDEFYEGAIDFQRLANGLRMNIRYTNFSFQYTDYVSDVFINVATPYFPVGGIPAPIDPFTLTQKKVYNRNVPLNYTNEKGVPSKGYFLGSVLNMTFCVVKERFLLGVYFVDNQLYYIIVLPYKEAKLETETPSLNDNNISGKYQAIRLKTQNVEEALAFLLAVQSSNVDLRINNTPIIDYKKVVIKEIYLAFSHAPSPGQINALYEQSPMFALKQRWDIHKLADIDSLLAFDQGNWIADGWYKDSSSTLIKLLGSFNDLGLLYDEFYKKPQWIVKIYSYLSTEAQQDFCILIKTLIDYKIQTDSNFIYKIETSFQTGKNYIVESDILETAEEGANGDQEDKGFNLNNYKIGTITEPIKNQTADYIMDPQDRIYDSKRQYREKIGGGSYHPMDMTLLIDNDSDTEKSELVPMICAKYLGDVKEWKEIAKIVRASADALIIVITIATAGTASPLMTALGIVDAAVSVTDLTIMALAEEELEKTEGGQEFLKAWHRVMLLAGATAAAPLLPALGRGIASGVVTVSSVLQKGFTLLSKVSKESTKTFIKSCLLKMMQEHKVFGTQTSKVKNLEVGAQILEAENCGAYFIMSQVDRLEEAGVAFVSGIDEAGEIVGYSAIYKGEVIARGTAKDIRETLKEVWILRGEKLVEGLAQILLSKKMKQWESISRKISSDVPSITLYQKSSNLDVLYADARVANQELEDLTISFANKTGGKPSTRPQSINNGLKGKERAMEKITADYEGNASRLVDIAGSKIVYERLDELYAALDMFHNSHKIVKIKDRILAPLKSGYRDILMNIEMNNGHIVEFRLHLKGIDDVAIYGHKFYQQRRTLEAISSERGLTIQEKQEIAKLMGIEKEFYEKAWNLLIKK